MPPMQVGPVDMYGRPIPTQVDSGIPYETVRVYDKPGIFLNQLLEGPTLAGLKNLAFNADKLSPTERQTLGGRIQAAAGMPRGEHPIVDAVVGAATNPLVWLFFLTASPASTALKAGRAPLNVAISRGAGLKDYATMMDKVGMTSAYQKAEGTIVHPVLQQLMRSLGIEGAEAEAAFDRAVRGRVGGKTTYLDPETLPMGASAADRQKAEELAVYLHNKLGGSDELGFIRRKVPRMDEARHWLVKKAVDERGQRRFDLEEVHGTPQERLAVIERAERERAILKSDMDEKRVLSQQVRASVEAGLLTKEDLRNALSEYKGAKARWEGADETASHVMGSSVKEDGAPRHVEMWTGVTPQDLARLEERNPEFTGIYEEVRKGLDEAMHKLYFPQGRDGPFDERAALKTIMNGRQDETHSLMGRAGHSAWNSGEGRDGMALATSERAQNAVRFGAVSPETYQREVANFVREGLEEQNYFPMNMFVERVGDPTLLKSGGRMVEDPVVWAGGGKAVGRATPVTEKGVMVDPEYLKMADRVVGTPLTKAALQQGQARYEVYRDQLLKADSKKHPIVYAPQRWWQAVTKARQDLRELKAMVDPVSQEVLDEQRRYSQGMRAAGIQKHSSSLPAPLVGAPDLDSMEGMSAGRRFQALDVIEDWQADEHVHRLPMGGISVVDALEAGINSIPSETVRDQLRNSVSVLTRRAPHQMTLLAGAVQSTKEWAQQFAGSDLGKMIAGTGRGGEKLVESIGLLGDPHGGIPSAGDIQSSIAKYIYLSHLGINLGSAMINSMQPLGFGAPTFGLKPTLRAFGDSLTEMYNYMEDRVGKYGFRRISHEERLPLLKKHYQWSSQMGVDVDFVHQMDGMIFNGQVTKNGGRLSGVGEMFMKSFEVSERLNRSWAANTVMRAYQYAGRPLTEEAKGQIAKWVQYSQFASDPFTVPTMFQKGILSAPLMRTLMTFPIRSAQFAFDQVTKFGEEPSYWKGLYSSMARGLGASALVYEIGKGLFGADTSRGLYGAASTDIFGGERFLEDGNNWIPIPPVVQIPKDVLTSMAQGDRQLFADAVLRLMPGGVAISKALQVAPELPSPVSALQKGSVGWNQPLKDGRVPAYDSQGRLVDFRSPTSLIFQGLGVDLGSGKQRGGELDGYLMNQREEILKYRQRYVNAMLANDVRTAQGVQAEFGRRFKDPLTKSPLKLTVTQEQLKKAMKSRQIPRPERILDTIPPEVRAALGQTAADASPSRFNVPAEDLFLRSTAGQRNREAPSGSMPTGPA